jgi:dTDP-4-amino-4,6-dideoxygalactose transaminase
VIYKVKYIDLYAQYRSLSLDIQREYKKIFKNSSFILRESVRNFEKSISKNLKVKYTVGLNSGTDALFMALTQLDLNKKDEIITASHTYVAAVSAILHVGAKPVFVDIQDDFNLNPDLIEAKITKKTKAILPVHLNGRCCNMRKIKKIAKEYNLKIIEDAAQAFGSQFNGKYAGTFGASAAFSLHPMKNLSVPGDGGFLTTDQKKIYQRVLLLRDHGRYRKNNINREVFKSFGFNSRLDNIHAAVALIKLKRFKRWIILRRKIANKYHAALKSISEIKIPLFNNETDKFYDTYNSYVIRTKKKDTLKFFLLKNGIEVFSHIHTGIHREKYLKERVGNWHLPKTDEVEKEIISLPIYPELSKKKQDYVIKKIKEFFSQ